MVQTAGSHDVDRLIDDVDRYWRSHGVPGQSRSRELEEISRHVVQQVAAGRDLHEIVGDDPRAFAAQWWRARALSPWLPVALEFVGCFVGVLALLALLASVNLLGDGGGIDFRAALIASTAAFVIGGRGAIFSYRERLGRGGAIVAGVCCAAAVGAVLLAGANLLRDVRVDVPVIWTVVMAVCGFGTLLVARMLRRMRSGSLNDRV
ncbi:hypothetical protein [Georgenia alba]|uniref:DUF1129 family protein n=1 Tax=Georgenia alba TaxID=2233858 RepID=A0ABW2QBI2_9MICO